MVNKYYLFMKKGGGGILGLVPQKLQTQVTSTRPLLSTLSICTLENGLISRNISSASNLCC